METDPRQFWNQKILVWERDRYGGEGARPRLLERMASSVSGLHARMTNAQRFLLPNARGRRVLELGCGSGLLAEALIQAGAESYRGIDFAASAVEVARRRVAATPEAPRITFEVGDPASLGADPQAELVFSLGFLDWLQEKDIDATFRLSAGRPFLHSFSERTASPWRYLHKAYVWMAYGRESGGYVPRYDSVDELMAVLRRHEQGPAHAFRDRAMRFGCFLTNLSLP